MMLRAARHFFNQCRLPKELSQDRRYDEFGLRVWNVAVHLSASSGLPGGG